jgi:branched-chain amino acid transport system permease protein
MITEKLIIEQIINGLVLGCIYASVASGLTLIWGTMKMLNFAHGEFYMLGGYISYYGLTILGIPLIFSIFLSVIGVFILGVLAEKTCVHPLLEKPEWDINAIVVTIGLSIFLQNFALRVWGERFKSVPYFLEGTFSIFGVRMAYQRILIIAITSVVMTIFWLFIKKTRFGLALRATAQEHDAACIVGINTKHIFTFTFGISCAMASLAAILLAPIFMINPWMGTVPLIKGFVTVVLGGLGSFGGAILGGILLGTAESLSVVIFSTEWKDVVAFIILILVLWVKPAGFFGKREW